MEWLVAAGIVIIIWLLLIWPADYIKEDKEKFGKYLYAHRGLHDKEKGIPENSLKAFDEACKAGYGMELDVHLSKDGQAVVFHDDTLKRMCGVDKRISELTYEEMQQYTLYDTDQKIPLFTEMLELVDGRTPLIVELKSAKKYDKLVAETNRILNTYKGDYCIESFNPMIVRKYAKTNPMVLRGFLVSNHIKEKSVNPILGFLMQEMLFNCLSRPQFIACNHNTLSLWGVNIVRFLFRPLMCAWTIKTPEEYEKIKNFDMIIFEGFLPDPTRPERKA